MYSIKYVCIYMYRERETDRERERLITLPTLWATLDM